MKIDIEDSKDSDVNDETSCEQMIISKRTRFSRSRSAMDFWAMQPRVTVTTITGGKETGRTNGLLKDALFCNPTALVHVADEGITFVTDPLNENIRCIHHHGGEGRGGCVTTLRDLINPRPHILLFLPKEYQSDDRYLLFASWTAIFSISKDGKHIKQLVGILPLLPGYADGVGDMVAFHNISGMVIDSLGRIVMSDRYNHRIRRMVIEKDTFTVTTIAGNGNGNYVDHENPLLASFLYPRTLCVDDKDNIFVVDSGNHCIRRIDHASGVVTTFAGNGTEACKDGNVQEASFTSPLAIIWEHNTKSLFVSDLYSIRRISILGSVMTIAGVREHGCVNGDGLLTRFNTVTSMAIERVEYYSPDWITCVLDLVHFSRWPPGVSDIVFDYLQNVISLILADTNNSQIRRLLISSSSL